GPQVQPDGPDRSLEHARSGDFDKVKEEVLGQIKADDPAKLIDRANAYWMMYVRERRGKDLKADAPPVVKALADLDNAIAKGNAEQKAEALLRRGQIRQMTKDLEGARGDFKAGLDEAKDDAQKERFEAALAALDLMEKVAMHLPPEVPPHVLALLLVNLQ